MTADPTPGIHNTLDTFAPENPIVPPRHARHTPLAQDFSFIFEPMPEPLAPVREARGHSWLVLTLLALLTTAALGVYLYYPSRPFDLDFISSWASSLASPPNTKMTTPAAAPSEAPPNDPTPTDPLTASKERAAVSEIARPAIARLAAARPESSGTSGSLVSPVQKLSGEWRLDIQTEASDSSLESVNLHFTMTLKQDGDRVTGVGTKVSETPTRVTMTGTIAGDRLTLNFVELGTQPETRGKIVLLIDKAETMRGRFSSSAAPLSGHVEAHRPQ